MDAGEAFTAERPGETGVEPHDEDGRRSRARAVHAVLRGWTRFLIGSQEIDAAAGDAGCGSPQEHREAVALKAGAAVLALGAEPALRPSPWE